jgi:hypothetical protein
VQINAVLAGKIVERALGLVTEPHLVAWVTVGRDAECLGKMLPL